MMPQYREINKAKQLLVEGNDADYFFTVFLEELGLTEIQVQNYGGIDELRGFLKQFSIAPGFWDRVESLGLVRDAEKNPKGAFQSVSGALGAAGLPKPKSPLEITTNQPHTSVLILPDAKTKGMLESVCLRSVANDSAMSCVDEYFRCLKDKLNSLPKNKEKARVQAFLASREKTPRMLGVAAKQSIWPWSSPAFENIRDFLNAL